MEKCGSKIGSAKTIAEMWSFGRICERVGQICRRGFQKIDIWWDLQQVGLVTGREKCGFVIVSVKEITEIWIFDRFS